jgi:hypothetical protein
MTLSKCTQRPSLRGQHLKLGSTRSKQRDSLTGTPETRHTWSCAVDSMSANIRALQMHGIVKAV